MITERTKGDVVAMPQTKILVVDDDEGILGSLEQLLQGLGFPCRTALSGARALEVLDTERFDVVVADIRMPEMDGMELLREIHRRGIDVDTIMMTAFDMAYSYVDVIEAGATDFIVKPFRQDELQAKIARIVRERALKAELLRLTINDPLTGLCNRRHLHQRLPEEVERATRQKHDIVLIILDLDNFKAYNDVHGHPEGDVLLERLGGILLSSIRQSVDIAFRYGGDEFAVLMMETDLALGAVVAERIRGAFADAAPGCSLSLGVAQLVPDRGADDLLRRADEAMYRAKRAGGDRVELSPVTTLAPHRARG